MLQVLFVCLATVGGYVSAGIYKCMDFFTCSFICFFCFFALVLLKKSSIYFINSHADIAEFTKITVRNNGFLGELC